MLARDPDWLRPEHYGCGKNGQGDGVFEALAKDSQTETGPDIVFARPVVVPEPTAFEGSAGGFQGPIRTDGGTITVIHMLRPLFGTSDGPR